MRLTWCQGMRGGVSRPADRKGHQEVRHGGVTPSGDQEKGFKSVLDEVCKLRRDARTRGLAGQRYRGMGVAVR